MKTYQFTVPESKASIGFEERLAERFGGFTVSGGVGAWVDYDIPPDQAYAVEYEPVQIYTVSVPFWRARKLIRFVLYELRKSGEKAAYVGRLGSATVIPL